MKDKDSCCVKALRVLVYMVYLEIVVAFIVLRARNLKSFDFVPSSDRSKYCFFSNFLPEVCALMYLLDLILRIFVQPAYKIIKNSHTISNMYFARNPQIRSLDPEYQKPLPKNMWCWSVPSRIWRFFRSCFTKKSKKNTKPLSKKDKQNPVASN